MSRAPIAQKMDLFAEAWANLSLVRAAWPNDNDAVVKSGVMQANLAAEFNLWPKAVDVLLEILPASDKTDAQAEVEQKLGQAYEQIGNVAESEKHLLAAERTMHRVHLNRVQSQDILSSVATFYARRNKPIEAIQRFREAAALEGQDPINKLQYQLSIAEQASLLGKDAADPELAHLDDLVSEARKSPLSPADAILVDHIAQHAQRVRGKSR